MRGFVDCQVNGYRECDFADPTLDGERAVAAIAGMIADGTAVLLPTLITAPMAVYERNLPLLVRAIDRHGLAGAAPGFHLEGPFLLPAEGAAGSHPREWMQAADPAVLDRLQDLASGRIRLLTVAADLPGAPGLIVHARRRGIAVSLGHHLATPGHLAAAVAAGATALTHLGNGLPHAIDRHANPLIAGLDADDLTAMVIGDGHHLPWELLRTILRVKGAARTVLVSDASPLAGMPPGRYRCFGSDAVISSDGRLANPTTGYLMGSSSTLRQIVNATRLALGLDDQTVHQLAVVNPLRLLGLDMDAGDHVDLPRSGNGSWLPP